MTRNGKFTFVVVAIALISLTCSLGQAQRKPASSAAHGPADTPVLIKCDMDCLLTIDGAQAVSLSSSDTKMVQLSSGQHLIEASDKDNTAKWSKVLSASGPDQIVLIIELQARVEQAAARKRSVEAQAKERADRQVEAEDLRQHPTWTDPATRLTWARQSSISDMNSDDADDYCRNSRRGGYSDWRVPTIQELQGIYDDKQSVVGKAANGWDQFTFHIKGGIRLTNLWIRSRSIGDSQRYILDFMFGVGRIHSAPREGKSAVLCVRP